MTMPVPSEEVEQRQLVRYLELMNCKFTSIPNSTYTPSWKQKMHNRDQGLRAGFPDLVIIANHHFFCIEMKRSIGGQTSKLQSAWHEALNAAGIPTFVCAGFDEAKKVVDTYLVARRQ